MLNNFPTNTRNWTKVSFYANKYRVHKLLKFQSWVASEYRVNRLSVFNYCINIVLYYVNIVLLSHQWSFILGNSKDKRWLRIFLSLLLALFLYQLLIVLGSLRESERERARGKERKREIAAVSYFVFMRSETNMNFWAIEFRSVSLFIFVWTKREKKLKKTRQ